MWERSPKEAQDEKALKDAFVKAWLRENDAFRAAVLVFGTNNAGIALQKSKEWPFDAYVIQEKEKLIAENDAQEFLPTKGDLVREAMQIAKDALYKDDKIKALRLAAELMGHISKEPKSSGGGFTIIPLNTQDQQL